MSTSRSSEDPPNAEASSGLLRAILESAVDYAIVTLDLDGIVTSWSHGAEHLLGWSSQEACGCGIDLIFTVDDLERGIPGLEMRNALKNGRGNDERWHVKKDGASFWASGEMLPLKNESGKPFGFLKILRDRTAQRLVDEERKAAERILREREAYLRLAIDAGQMAVWDYDIVDKKLVGSAELNFLFGFPQDAALEIEDIRACYFPGEHERMMALGAMAMERGDRNVETEFRCVWPDSSIHWLMLRAEIFRNEDGLPIRYLGVLLDATRRKSAEMEFARSEALKSAMLQASLDCIITIDREGRVLEWNKAAEEVFGFPRMDAIGKDLSELIIPHELRQAHHDGMRRYLATGEGPVIGKRIEMDALRRDESRFPIELAISPVQIGDRLYFTAFLRDITSRREQELQRQLLTRELAHRVKNTLALVQSIVSQTLRQTDNTTDAKRAIEGRLTALAQAHESLISADWSNAPIHLVVESVLKPHRSGTGRFTIVGDTVNLTGKQALGLSLALNELATNAVKYGALSNDAGRVGISWWLVGAVPNKEFCFEWKEHDGPPVEKPTRAGFGSRMIERSLAGYFDGVAVLAYEPDGFRLTLQAPFGEAAAASGSVTSGTP